MIPSYMLDTSNNKPSSDADTITAATQLIREKYLKKLLKSYELVSYI